MPDGYAWWYVDATSDDGQYGISVIAFIGSAFSPYYAWARRKAWARPNGPVDPLNHCAINVALYGKGGGWAMTERGSRHVALGSTTLAIGPSSLAWDGACLTIDIDEITVPLPSRLRGTIRLHAETLTQQAFAIDGAGRHKWWPIAPRARVEVDLQRPGLAWRGNGYFDHNSGCEPLAQAFRSWHWSRANLRQGAAVLYETQPLAGEPVTLALRFGPSGEAKSFAPPPMARLPRSGWRIQRETRTDAGGVARVIRTLEDTPFYARSLLATRLLGEDVIAIHESLSVSRFDTPLVRLMLPFRMPRRG